jgi:sugar (pentulose or hexulose) kinase
LGEAASLGGGRIEKPALYDALYEKALEGDADCGGLVNYNFYSGEPVIRLENARPLFTREPGAALNLANFMRAQLFSCIAALKCGMDILVEKEHVCLDRIAGHGGFFKTPRVGQRLMAAALGVPVAVFKSAGEGGAWGAALLAAYRLRRICDIRDAAAPSLGEWLAGEVFTASSELCVDPVPPDVEGFATFMRGWKAGIALPGAAAGKP